MNGREAVTKWRAGGFHLVLMDIQLPVMNGLDATKEIRRLERLNNIGVLSGSAANSANVCSDQETTENDGKAEGEDCLTNRSLFKSPVIIVALTASSLQSDRHEALAAGCNDFLTKVRTPYFPVKSFPPPKQLSIPLDNGSTGFFVFPLFFFPIHSCPFWAEGKGSPFAAFTNQSSPFSCVCSFSFSRNRKSFTLNRTGDNLTNPFSVI